LIGVSLVIGTDRKNIAYLSELDEAGHDGARATIAGQVGVSPFRGGFESFAGELLVAELQPRKIGGCEARLEPEAFAVEVEFVVVERKERCGRRKVPDPS
jgi:hypothetical protein